MNQIVEYRREFHKYPENGWREIRTSARIAEILTGLGYHCLVGEEVVNVDSIVKFVRPSKEEIAEQMKRAVEQGANPEYVERTHGVSGVIAEYDTGREGPITAFRFDIDCLPYEEPHEKGFRPFDEGYISVNPESVHACGHDAHTAMGLGIATRLMEDKEQMCGKIRMIFQPAEETFGGALSIVDKGWLDDVDYFIAFHDALTNKEGSQLLSHTMCCGCKDFVSARQLDVTFHGRASHPCSAPQDGKNALLAACTAVLNLHAIAQHTAGLSTVNVGEMKGGVAPNTIAPEALIKIEYRGEKKEICDYLEKRVFDILDGCAKAYDITYTYDDYGEVACGKSDDAMMEIIQRAAKKVPWFTEINFEGCVGGTDDAATMMTRVQEHGGIGSYVGIGANTTGPLHDPKFDLDEDCILAAIDLGMNALHEIHAIH